MQPYSGPTDDGSQPFDDSEQAWFWFMDANEYRLSGARHHAGMALIPRKCNPTDILVMLDRLYKSRRLSMDHLRVLRFYGLRKMAPDPHRPHEARAAELWKQGMAALQELLDAKGLIHKSPEPADSSI